MPPLCLDALLHHVNFIADRLDEPAKYDGCRDPTDLLKQRELKQTIIAGASRFNESPKKGIAYLAQQGVIDSVENPQSIAKFLKGTTRINKAILGDYISHRDNEAILRVFLELFDFKGKRVDEALRLLLESFRLPGESALIERIVTCFAEKYCAHDKPPEVHDADAVFVLSYAIIMLNTDQHSPKVKVRYGFIRAEHEADSS